MARLWSEDVEEFLEVLCWGTGKMLWPTLPNLERSWEARQWRCGFPNKVRRLEERALLQRERHARALVCRLTELGRLTSLGGRDPERMWQRPWDGQWRMVVFDLPAGSQKVRARLLRWLRQNGFGYLQNSVWIHPDPVQDALEALGEFRDDVETFTILEARCCAGCSNDALVQGAWDFTTMNKRYETHLSQANGELRQSLPSKNAEAELRARLRQERRAWGNAVSIDPLLTRELLPSGYLGGESWQAHRRVMTRLVNALTACRP